MAKIVVCIKQVPDTAQLKIDPSLSGDALLAAIKATEQVMNPFCEYAVETALRLKEGAPESTITCISAGAASARDVLKKALSMGCDEAILITDPALETMDATSVAKVLATAIQQHAPDATLVVTGQLTTDGASGLVGPQLAEFLGWERVSFCKDGRWQGSELEVDCEFGSTTVRAHVTLPIVVSTMKCDYEPRIPSIKGVMKANRAEIAQLDLAALGLSADTEGLKRRSTVPVLLQKPPKPPGQKIDGSDPHAAVDQLLAVLHDRKVL